MLSVQASILHHHINILHYIQFIDFFFPFCEKDVYVQEFHDIVVFLRELTDITIIIRITYVESDIISNQTLTQRGPGNVPGCLRNCFMSPQE